MATNRLYVIHRESKQYLCIAKDFEGWCLGNLDLFNKFINSFGIKGEGKMELLDENSDEFMELMEDKEWENFNLNNKWEYYEPNI